MLRTRRLLAVLGAVVLAIAVSPAARAAVQPGVPSVSDEALTNAEPPVAVPAGKPCVETVLVHTFANSYYAPGYGQHRASACTGPWSAVTLTASFSVTGVQFDRLVDVYVGKALLLSSSTSEPASETGAVTHWSVTTDVSRFAGLLATSQPITTILNNVNDTTYTGQYATTETLSFYPVGATAPKVATPDVVVPVYAPSDPGHLDGPGNLGGDGFYSFGATSDVATQQVTLPRNLLTLGADVYAQGHGACEEFWWSEPNQCGIGTPYREVELDIDGVRAGFAPVYPTVFTGGGGPGLWEPIASPRAWHLDPYHLDLTPFVGRLVDGQPHTVSISLPDAVYQSGDYWLVGATLLGTTDKGTAQTSGALVSVPVAPLPNTDKKGNPGDTTAQLFHAAHGANWSGYVVGSAGRVDTFVSETIAEHTKDAGLGVDSSWTWIHATGTTPAGGTKVTTATTNTYRMVETVPLAAFDLLEDGVVTTVNGPHPTKTQHDLVMSTHAVGLAFYGAEHEEYSASDSSGGCYDHVLEAAAGGIVLDTSGCDLVSGVTSKVH